MTLATTEPRVPSSRERPANVGQRTKAPAACLYRGTVRHRRHTPIKHEFAYTINLFCIDLDEVESVFRFPGLWSTRPFSIVRFRRADYYGDPEQPPATCIRELVLRRTGQNVSGPVRLLTQLRRFGVVFNPISLYYCYDENGVQLQAIVAEVTNTPWGERHCYVIDCTTKGPVVRHDCEKQLHVSPFMPMDLTYRWRLTAPGEGTSVSVETIRDGETVFDATLTLQRQPLTVWSAICALSRFPPAPLQVLGAIYWQALRLWWKGVPFVRHPKHQQESPD